MPDIIILDVSISFSNSSKNNLELLIKIKELDSNANVIVMASQGEEKLIMEAIKDGAKGYILKPIAYANIKQTIDKMLA